jgi:plastocyanin
MVTASPQKFRVAACALVATSLALLVLSADASALVSGYTEPGYTKTAGNNAYWYNWTAVTGVDSNGNTNYTYYLCINTYHNGMQEEFSNGTNGPGSTNCTGSLRSGPTPASGNNGFVPYTGGTVLSDGHQYQMCVVGYRANVFVWSSDGPSSCPSTVIDRNVPTLGATLAGGSNLTNNPTIPVAISYSDPTSPPWFGSNNRASNWVCINQGASCTPGGQPNTDCSVPNAGFGQRNNSFNCALSIGGSDGTYYFCTFGADQAVPDNPTGTNQFANATSNNANISSTACDSVILDRAAPSVSVTPSATTVTVGELVNFSMSASDPNGLSGAVAWDFGDNTSPGSGPTASHTYTQPGTFVVKAKQSDAAGNLGEGTTTITVNPAGGSNPGGSNPGGSNPGGSNPGGSNPGGSNPGGSDPGGTVPPGTQQGTTGATPLTGGTTTSQVTQQVQQQAGGGGASNVTVGALDVIAPRRFVAGKTTMLLAFTAESAGDVNVALLKGSKIVAKKGAAFGGPGTYTLKLKVPKKLKPGSYKLKVTFKPQGASKGVTKTIGVKVQGKKKKGGKKVVNRRALRGTRLNRSTHPGAVDPRSVERTIAVR